MEQKEVFLEKSNSAISSIYDIINDKKSINISDLDYNRTALIIVDMVNGFVKEGALSSERALSINDKIADISKEFSKLNMKKIAFADTHTQNSPEFLSFPVHCIKGDRESKLTDEIAESGNYVLIEKNSTNGLLEPEFLDWLNNNNDIDNFVVVGTCTDLCVQQFSLSLKAYFNMKNLYSRIIVVENLVETYDLDVHFADLMNLMAIYNMSISGIEIVSGIEF